MGVTNILCNVIHEGEQMGQFYGLTQYLDRAMIICRNPQPPFLFDVIVPNFPYYFQFLIEKDPKLFRYYIQDYRLILPYRPPRKIEQIDIETIYGYIQNIIVDQIQSLRSEFQAKIEEVKQVMKNASK